MKTYQKPVVEIINFSAEAVTSNPGTEGGTTSNTIDTIG